MILCKNEWYWHECGAYSAPCDGSSVPSRTPSVAPECPCLQHAEWMFHSWMQPQVEAKKKAVEALAKILHETGRAAVEANKVYRNDLPVKPFCEWDNLSEEAKEGRRMMAEALAHHGYEVVRLFDSI